MGRLNGHEQISLVSGGGFIENDGEVKAVVLEAVVVFALLMFFFSGGSE